MQFGRPRVFELTKGAAAVVQSDAVRKPRPRKRLDLLDVVQELDDFEGARPDVLDVRRLLDGVEIISDVVDAASRRRDDGVEAGKVAHEEGFRRGAVRIEAAIRHRLAAACLVAWVDDLMAEALQELERRDADFGKEGVDIAGDEKPNAHAALFHPRSASTVSCISGRISPGLLPPLL